MDGRIGAIREALDIEGFKMFPLWLIQRSTLLPSMDHLEMRLVQKVLLDKETNVPIK